MKFYFSQCNFRELNNNEFLGERLNYCNKDNAEYKGSSKIKIYFSVIYSLRGWVALFQSHPGTLLPCYSQILLKYFSFLHG